MVRAGWAPFACPARPQRHLGEGVTRLGIPAGGEADCCHRMLLPGSFAEWFVIDGITPADLAKHLNVDPVAARLSGRFLGYRVVPMGRSWAVYFAQSCMQDLVARRGGSVLKAELALVEGARTPELSASAPFVHSEYVDDFAVVGVEGPGREGCVQRAYESGRAGIPESGL